MSEKSDPPGRHGIPDDIMDPSSIANLMDELRGKKETSPDLAPQPEKGISQDDPPIQQFTLKPPAPGDDSEGIDPDVVKDLSTNPDPSIDELRNQQRTRRLRTVFRQARDRTEDM